MAPLLFKIATNLWRDRRGGQLVSGAIEVNDEPGPSNVAAEVIQRLESQEIAAALGGLRPEYREVISLRYDQGLSYREIAQVTGASEKTVATWLRRGVAALRAALAISHEKEVAR